MSDVVRNNSSISFHLSKLSNAKFSILYDMFLVRDWKRKSWQITPGSERVEKYLPISQSQSRQNCERKLKNKFSVVKDWMMPTNQLDAASMQIINWLYIEGTVTHTSVIISSFKMAKHFANNFVYRCAVFVIIYIKCVLAKLSLTFLVHAEGDLPLLLIPFNLGDCCFKQNLHVNKTSSHMKGFALGSTLKQRWKATQESSIDHKRKGCFWLNGFLVSYHLQSQENKIVFVYIFQRQPGQIKSSFFGRLAARHENQTASNKHGACGVLNTVFPTPFFSAKPHLHLFKKWWQAERQNFKSLWEYLDICSCKKM